MASCASLMSWYSSMKSNWERCRHTSAAGRNWRFSASQSTRRAKCSKSEKSTPPNSCLRRWNSVAKACTKRSNSAIAGRVHSQSSRKAGQSVSGTAPSPADVRLSKNSSSPASDSKRLAQVFGVSFLGGMVARNRSSHAATSARAPNGLGKAKCSAYATKLGLPLATRASRQITAQRGISTSQAASQGFGSPVVNAFNWACNHA